MPHIQTPSGRRIHLDGPARTISDLELAAIDADIDTASPVRISELVRDDPRFARDRANMAPTLRAHLYGPAA